MIWGNKEAIRELQGSLFSAIQRIFQLDLHDGWSWSAGYGVIQYMALSTLGQLRFRPSGRQTLFFDGDGPGSINNFPFFTHFDSVWLKAHRNLRLESFSNEIVSVSIANWPITSPYFFLQSSKKIFNKLVPARDLNHACAVVSTMLYICHVFKHKAPQNLWTENDIIKTSMAIFGAYQHYWKPK